MLLVLVLVPGPKFIVCNFSACSSDVSDGNEIFHDVSPPYEPLVGS
jgi:hypothetical protein